MVSISPRVIFPSRFIFSSERGNCLSIAWQRPIFTLCFENRRVLWVVFFLTFIEIKSREREYFCLKSRQKNQIKIASNANEMKVDVDVEVEVHTDSVIVFNIDPR